jgi:signal transduction histidine kinase
MNRIGTLARSWIPIAAILGAGLLIVAGVTIAALNEKGYWQRRVDSLAAQGEVLAATVEPALLFLDPAAARDAVSALKANPDVEVAGVYDAQGVLVARFGRGGATPPAIAPAAGHTRTENQVIVAVPVRHEGQAIGEVYLRTAAEPLHALVGRHAGTLLLLATSVIVVALLQAVQLALTRAGRETETRARELASANAALQEQVQRREFAEEALRQAQKMETLGRLTGGIAHDFNNLLQGVQGALDIIARSPENTRKVARWSAAGLEAAERGARLTAQLLAFSRAQKLELRPIDVAEVTGRLGQLLPSSLGPGVKVVFDLEENDMPVIADSTQLELAVLNLCINARDAMPNGGEITIRTRRAHLTNDPELRAGDYLLLSVSDNGVGMPADVRAHAFEPFFTTKGVGKGTGLGLAQVYGIAKQAGGVARIESAPEEGTTVTIYLPPAEVTQAAAAAEAVAPAPAAGGGALILVVDDDAGVRDYVVEVLEGLGYATLAAEDGPTGLAVLDRETVDLVVLDYAMPGMTGAEMAQQALKARPGLPILFASGYAETEALEGVSGRPVRLLRKPFQAERLAEAVHEALTAAA